MISFIIPSYNNLQHLKNVYASIKKHEPQAEVVLLDDGSTDNTWEWIQQQDCIKFRSEERVGHTILYDKGIELATNDIVGILHADMIVGPNYSKNLIKHLKPQTVVCATRIEPPLHPEGKEKIIRDFGMDFDTLDVASFEEFVRDLQAVEGETTKGMFAPWILYKEDFQAVGGHDPLFAPFPYEDSDIFQRWIMAGYELIQSRDSFVYHLTCRGHRWNEQVGKDDEYYKQVSNKAARNYIRKWGSWIANDEYQYPIIKPKYNIALVVKKCNYQLLELLEPWCDRIYIEDEMGVLQAAYYENEQKNTSYDLKKRVLTIEYNDPKAENDIIVELSRDSFIQEDFGLLQQLAEIIKSSGEPGEFSLGNLDITIHSMTEYQNGLVVCEN
jgi:glycosyltransferase involved in cell wall biosynthesis